MSVFLDGQEPHLAFVARHGGIRAHPDGVEGRPGRGFGSDDDFIFPAFFHGHRLVVKGVSRQIHRGQVDGQFLGDGDFNGLGKISVFTGTNDILYPDAKKFKNMAEEKGIKINYYEYWI